MDFQLEDKEIFKWQESSTISHNCADFVVSIEKPIL